VWKLAERQLEREFSKAVRLTVKAEINSDSRATIYVDDRAKPQIIGRGGSRISELESQFGFRFDVRTFREAKAAQGEEVAVVTGGNHLILDLPQQLRGRNVEVTVGDRVVFKGAASKSGSIKLEWESALAERILEALQSGVGVYARRPR